MKFAFEFSNLCGSSFNGGNVVFTSDGNSILSPVGNRISVFDLVNHRCSTMPFENRTNISRIALSPNGNMLVSIDDDGHALLINVHKRVVVNSCHFKGHVRDACFSPDGKYFAITHGKHVQVWHAPSNRMQYAPFSLFRTYTRHMDEVVHIHWSPDSRFFFTSSLDASVRMFSLHTIDGFRPLTLSGHRNHTVGSFFDASRGTLYTVSKDGALFIWKTDAPASALETARFDLERKIYFEKNHAQVQCVTFQEHLVVVGFNNGTFSLYELPDGSEIHSLSVSQQRISTVAVCPRGQWLAFGSAALGQLLVWEWQSETYILKQQGHAHDVNAVAFSPDGQLMATGGDDGKVKIWNTTTGFCFATFADHSAPVTDVCITSAGNVVVSASLDGTVRAYDLVRYRNFRTMVAPMSCQFLSLAIDPSGEVVCAGALDPFDVFVWSLQTGKLLDVLAGHEGPVCSLSFSAEQSMLASGSWDKTVKLWDVFAEHRKSATETLSHGTDVLAVAFRHDGNEVCSASLDGQLQFWDVNRGVLKSTIEGREDIRGGRRQLDRRTASTTTYGTAFTSVCYSADGSCVLAGGNSKFVCLYAVEPGLLVRKFQISSNRALDGVVDMLNSGKMTDAGPVDEIDDSDSDEDTAGARAARRDANLPGVAKGDLSKRRATRPAVATKCVRFSPTGRSWAAASTEGLLVYSLDQDMTFDPVDIDEDVTPERIAAEASSGNYGRALVMALRLNDNSVLRALVRATPPTDVPLVVRAVPHSFLERVINLVADGFEKSADLELHLIWAVQLLTTHGEHLKRNAHHLLPAFRALHKAMGAMFSNLSTLCNRNQYLLEFLAGREPPVAEA